MKEEKPVVVKESFDVSPRELWDAITSPERMVLWFFEDIPSFEPKVGFSTRFNVVTPNRDFVHLWSITDVDHGRKIVYDWRYEGYKGKSKVTFEIAPAKDGSILTVTHVNTIPYDQGIPEFRRESCLGGWKYFISERLKTYLESNSK